MEYQLKTASNDALIYLQKYLDERDEDEHMFKVSLQWKLDDVKINVNLS